MGMKMPTGLKNWKRKSFRKWYFEFVRKDIPLGVYGLQFFDRWEVYSFTDKPFGAVLLGKVATREEALKIAFDFMRKNDQHMLGGKKYHPPPFSSICEK